MIRYRKFLEWAGILGEITSPKKAALAYDSDRLNFTQRRKATQTFQLKMLRTMKQQKDE